MNNSFYCDIQNNVCKTWEQLAVDLKAEQHYSPFLKRDNYYDVFLNIVISLLVDRAITLLDSDFTSTEITALTGEHEPELKTEEIDIDQSVLISKTSLLSALNASHPNWAITIYTSGTTGLPKTVTHTFETLTRFVQLSDKHKDSVWGFAYNPTHMAGLQVFFQALLNGSKIVRLFQLSKEQIFEQITKHNITHISATPTFYRLLLPCQQRFESVKRITSGGEKFDANMAAAISQIFPNAKITNVYASTEIGTLFASQGDVFEVREKIAGQVCFDQGELLIHKSLLGQLPNQDDQPWYRTGDLVEIMSENPIKFRFLSRKNEMINVGGYKVNPHEVEQIIREYPGVNDVKVHGKANSILGSVIVAEVVSDGAIEEVALRAYMQTKLQEYKIPRMVKFIKQIELTRTGKMKRV